jgi:hypothetical protein
MQKRLLKPARKQVLFKKLKCHMDKYFPAQLQSPMNVCQGGKQVGYEGSSLVPGSST